jgi:hypothetical protein
VSVDKSSTKVRRRRLRNLLLLKLRFGRKRGLSTLSQLGGDDTHALHVSDGVHQAGNARHRISREVPGASIRSCAAFPGSSLRAGTATLRRHVGDVAHRGPIWAPQPTKPRSSRFGRHGQTVVGVGRDHVSAPVYPCEALTAETAAHALATTRTLFWCSSRVTMPRVHAQQEVGNFSTYGKSMRDITIPSDEA